MKFANLACLAIIATGLTACGSDEKTTVIHERPVVVAPARSGVTPADVEDYCVNGYDNRSRSCY